MKIDLIFGERVFKNGEIYERIFNECTELWIVAVGVIDEEQQHM